VTTTTATETRPLWQIADDITSCWEKPYFGAVPYIRAMGDLDKITGTYGHDDAESIVLRFLSNARYWRGEDAARIKAELKALLP
jgi:hypothetical protein